MYFADLDECRYHSGAFDTDSWQVPLVTVGWLEHPHPFSRGKSPESIVSQLRDFISLAKEAHPHINFRGLHDCSLCQVDQESVDGLVDSHVNIFVPGNGVVFIAPGGITHYVQTHIYLPPTEFIAALSQCPAYGSPEFYQALRAVNKNVQPPIRSWDEVLSAYRREHESRRAGDV